MSSSNQKLGVTQHCFFTPGLAGPICSSSSIQFALFLTCTEPASLCAPLSTNRHTLLRSECQAYKLVLCTWGCQHSQAAPFPWRSEFLPYRAPSSSPVAQIAMAIEADHSLLRDVHWDTMLLAFLLPKGCAFSLPWAWFFSHIFLPLVVKSSLVTLLTIYKYCVGRRKK